MKLKKFSVKMLFEVPPTVREEFFGVLTLSGEII
jgi:hypothetical protein